MEAVVRCRRTADSPSNAVPQPTADSAAATPLDHSHRTCSAPPPRRLRRDRRLLCARQAQGTLRASTEKHISVYISFQSMAHELSSCVALASPHQTCTKCPENMSGGRGHCVVWITANVNRHPCPCARPGSCHRPHPPRPQPGMSPVSVPRRSRPLPRIRPLPLPRPPPRSRPGPRPVPVTGPSLAQTRPVPVSTRKRSRNPSLRSTKAPSPPQRGRRRKPGASSRTLTRLSLSVPAPAKPVPV